MSTDEIKVGDRVTLGGPTATAYVVVAAGPEWCAIDCADRPTSSPGVVPTGDLRKLKEPTPVPERWVNIYPDRVAGAHISPADADRWDTGDRIGILHIRPDGTTEFTRTEEL